MAAFGPFAELCVGSGVLAKDLIKINGKYFPAHEFCFIYANDETVI